ncbi:histidine kinase [Aquitalea magnusonii]|uniref:sensor histidine kinase n=1 Tax=Aquitalea sp. USM4 TaxID=1590041 RepID=UPI0005F8549F|nr:ATP-binding protein [Aquitalea sp. USM4]KJV25977.1 histidine kinase [Aquitalea magnusonii]QBJ77858.1 histidine kinase [Aquitalea sp. USM4]
MTERRRGRQPFRIAARAMRQLGAELITSDEMALYELIKNGFDARSPRTVVSISAPADASAVALIREQLATGKISTGIALERLEKTLSSDLDLEQRAQVLSRFKEHASTSTVLHDYLDTFIRDGFWIEVKDTGSGMSADDLHDKFMLVGTPNRLDEKSSSERTILGEKGIGRLSMMKLGEVARVHSKVEGSTIWSSIQFDWKKFDEPGAELGQVFFEVSPGAAESPEVHGTVIRITELLAHWSAAKVNEFLNKYVRRLQDPFAKPRRPYPIDVFLNGHRLPIVPIPSWLLDVAQFQCIISYTPSATDVDTVALRREVMWKGSETSETRTWTLNELAAITGVPIETCRKLGPFNASCYWFNRSLIVGTVEHTKSKMLAELNVWCGGFAVYRDGFRVGQTGGMEDDWLEWDGKALKTKGFMLNRYQTVGTISITSHGNPRLIDAANRERLVSCSEQNLLVSLFGDVIVKDLRSHIDAIKQVEVKKAIEEESAEESLKRSEDSLKSTLTAVEEIAKSVPHEVQPKVEGIRRALQDQVEYVETIKNALKLARETRVELLELANIGLVVEIVVHELTRLTQSTGDLLVDLRKTSTENTPLVSLIDNLQSQIKATSKRISSVDVLSPSGRNRKDRYDVVAQLKTIVGGFEARFRRHSIQCEVLVDGAPAMEQKFEAYLVRGLIAQVLENLLTNSIYWVQQGQKRGEAFRRIVIELDTSSSTVLVTDNGPGIDPSHAEAIFRPYFSMRKRGKGLGLYIARELVEYHGGKLYMDASGEEDGRIRTFVLELPREEKK